MLKDDKITHALDLTVPQGNSTKIFSEDSFKEMKTVHEVCKEFNITRKTLYYYDKIGILKPTYRSGIQKEKLYGNKAIKRLEDIILYRKAGLSLTCIKTILDDESVDRISFLKISIVEMQMQKKELNKKIAFANELISKLEEDKK